MVRLPSGAGTYLAHYYNEHDQQESAKLGGMLAVVGERGVLSAVRSRRSEVIVEEKELSTPYGAVAYRVRAGEDGRVVVLLHGRAADASQWDDVLSFLDASSTVVTVDLPCHGASRAYEGFLYDRTADHVADIMRRELSMAAFVVGHSVGGSIAQVLAARHPELVAGLLIADAAPVRREAYSSFDRFALKRSASSLLVYEERSVRGLAGGMAKELTATTVGRERLHEVFARSTALELCHLVSIADGGLMRFLERLDEPLSVACPLSLVCGSRDKLNKIVRSMRAWASQANVSLRMLEGCGHFCMLDDPRAFASLIEACLSSASRSLATERAS